MIKNVINNSKCCNWLNTNVFKGFQYELSESYEIDEETPSKIEGYSVIYDTLGGFHPENGTWTVPETGYYEIIAQVVFDHSTLDGLCSLRVLHEWDEGTLTGSTLTSAHNYLFGGGFFLPKVECTSIHYLEKDDIVVLAALYTEGESSTSVIGQDGAGADSVTRLTIALRSSA